jgi:inactivated superfamily I helicase
MLPETPHHPPSSLRGFLQQYAMIVLSILTALALEQMVVSIHNASTARDSRRRIESEIARFVTDLKKSAQTNMDRLKSVNDVLTVLDAKLKDGNPDTATVQALAQKALDDVGISFPSYQRDAWEAAIADQSVSHLGSSDLRRYSQIYADEIFAVEEARLLLSGDYVRRVSDTKLAYRIGKLDGQKLAETLTLDSLVGQDILEQQERLIRLIESGQKPDWVSH